MILVRIISASGDQPHHGYKKSQKIHAFRMCFSRWLQDRMVSPAGDYSLSQSVRWAVSQLLDDLRNIDFLCLLACRVVCMG